MNTLSTNSLCESLGGFSGFKDAVSAISDMNEKQTVNITGLKGSLHSYFIREYLKNLYAKRIQALSYRTSGIASKAIDSKDSELEEKLLVVVPTERDGESLKADLETVFPEAETNLLLNWGTLAYRPASVNSLVFGKRAGVFSKMALKRHGAKAFEFHPEIFIVPLKAFLSPSPSPEYVRSLSFSLEKGEAIDTISVSEKLSSLGYSRVSKVTVRGEFSLRGEVLDIFLPDESLPVRVVFDFDRIENIKTFDAESQNTVSSADSVLVYPMKEVIWNGNLVSVLEKKLEDSNGGKSSALQAGSVSCDEDFSLKPDSCSGDDFFSGDGDFSDGADYSEINGKSPHLDFTDEAKSFRDKMIENLERSGRSEGEELFYPLLWNKDFSILDFFPPALPVFLFDSSRIENSRESIGREYSGMYRKARLELPVLPPEEILFGMDFIFGKIKRCVKFRTILSDDIKNPLETSLEIPCDASQSYFGNFNLLKDELKSLLGQGWSVYVFADNENQALRISEILKDFVNPTGEDKNLKPLVITGQAISEGFSVPELKIKVIQENEIFGRKKYIPKTSRRAKSEAIDTFVELNPGDFVVHVNYGIGVFLGIDRVHALGNERDYIKLEYADEEFLFVPIEQVNLVQRYIGNEGEAPHIDRIGSKSWENRKNKVKKAVEDLAQKLIDLYSRRKAARGFPFPKDTEWQTAFEASFPYEDTPDQISVTEEIKRDMENPVPMDRLICGDVGYGKTEIAMRAAFKAVMGGKQVAFLAPTTILAEQHYETCLERFRNFPVKIAHLSRFVNASGQKKILKSLSEGQVDILIGTHRIIQKDVVFKNLGLMIVDEEQRFGVKDKEKLKVLRNNIDCLAMSATPIPRTLHMSLLKIRDMSLLATPPQSRKPIETVIDAYSDERVLKAIRNEVERGGQVFYLHNRVESLYETRLKLERLLPEMMIDVAHGQMTSEQLDDIFRRFKMGGFHVLVATTIIENGIDIPNVNTIIIDRADMYGVSQLYQLRGRVGRSDRKAYAYLLYPGNKSLSEVAMKRLQVISDFTELGSGFKIAMKDMEIRGAGNLLGRDQSGNVYSVGFDMYVRLLNEAVNRLMASENYQAEEEVLLELEYTGFIPETYIKNPQIKMEIYKKIASVVKSEDLDSVYLELNDRFGPIPEEVLSLLSLAQIRILCKKLHVSKIKEFHGKASVEFSRVSDINVDKVVRLLSESSGTVQLDAKKPNILYLNTGKIDLKTKSEFIKEKLEKIV